MDLVDMALEAVNTALELAVVQLDQELDCTADTDLERLAVASEVVKLETTKDLDIPQSAMDMDQGLVDVPVMAQVFTVPSLEALVAARVADTVAVTVAEAEEAEAMERVAVELTQAPPRQLRPQHLPEVAAAITANKP
ncbi:uncharacterized protein LOC121405301 isoform X2 [Drosophila obscura]|uniref:uncharacterized protein LOC121405301 isoform X2 n=1 Tax=Drosophila obscura TaxID=7282 RepID=UPI001BB1AB22|nr:uncharacterized protein LOC121405301 isoform X2 [Drosophila obscura]XP_041451861.1 uncharacterized protein LOC121405301 isoform X2 [Drosophila obscura]